LIEKRVQSPNFHGFFNQKRLEIDAFLAFFSQKMTVLGCF